MGRQYLLQTRSLHARVGAEDEDRRGREGRVAMLEETFVKEVVILTTSSITMSWALGGIFHICYPVRLVHFYSRFTDKKN